MRIYCNISGRGSSSKNRLSFRCGKCPAMTSSIYRRGLFGGKPRNLMRPPFLRWMATSSSKYNGSLALQGQRRGDFLCLAKVSAQDLLCYSTDHRITHMLVADFESIPLADVFASPKEDCSRILRAAMTRFSESVYVGVSKSVITHPLIILQDESSRRHLLCETTTTFKPQGVGQLLIQALP